MAPNATLPTGSTAQAPSGGSKDFLPPARLPVVVAEATSPPVPAPLAAEPLGLRFLRWWRQVSSCLVSLVVHATLVVLLGLWATTTTKPPEAIRIGAVTLADEAPLLTSAELEPQPAVVSFERPQHIDLPHTAETISRSIGAQVHESDRVQGAAPSLPLAHFGVELPGDGSLFRAFDADVDGALAGRGSAERAKLVEEGGGTPETEAAVERGLRWLAAHQLNDGSWRFDLHHGPCQGLCGDSGTEPSTTASTALALLAFLGHGQTQREGEFQEQVGKGLKYLCGRDTRDVGDLRDGSSMYCQGLAAIAVCEAYAMTRDASLEFPAQKAIDFIVDAQDKRGGGWRYQPRMPGDTTVTGWQIMALKSAQMGYLRVPQTAIAGAVRFLDSVQEQQGAKYRYLPGKKNLGKDLTTTAVGLLCRMYTGWPRDYTPLQEGVRLLSAEGPSDDNMYYNYYGTQVMHHWGGEEWQFWNYRMCDLLLHTQATVGHEAGSWHFSGGQGNVGGRLYNTALAAMTLEVYYRHLPLYRNDATDDGF